MKKIIISLFLSTYLSAFNFSFFDNTPKCNDEAALEALEELIRENAPEVIFKYGVIKAFQDEVENTIIKVREFKDYDYSYNGNFAESYAANAYKPVIDLLNQIIKYVNTNVKMDFSSFVTLKNEDDRARYCNANLKFVYPTMPNELSSKITDGKIKGIVVNGGENETTIKYKTYYTDDKEQVYVELIDY